MSATARGSLAERARWLPLVALLVLAGGAVAEAVQDSPPALPFVDRNACPVESGCNFHADWVAETPLTAYATEGRPTRVEFRIATGEHFAALRSWLRLSTPTASRRTAGNRVSARASWSTCSRTAGKDAT
ncbi:MAG: hypothetical protein DME17_11640 [Candidatus Rokuibacteriota bacterium]|nr:MAG: hypothetical protein DME17_11640 [Candidatus Rokubacteria bacterium]